MIVTVNHKLTKSEAKARILNFASEIKKKFANELVINREEDRGDKMFYEAKIMGYNIKLEVEINNSNVTVSSKLPFVIKMFEGRVEKEVRDTLNKILEQ